MKKTLILLSYSYPYNQGETYIENEIPYLEKSFDEIIVFSISGSRKNAPTRKTGKNVRVFPIDCGRQRALNVLNGLFLKPERYKRNAFPSLKRYLADSYLLGRNKRIFSKIVRITRSENVHFEAVAIYSYWLLFAPAAVQLKDYLLAHGVKNVKVISRGHGYDVYSEQMPFGYPPFQEQSIANLDGSYICSQTGADYLRKKYPIFESKIHVSRLGTVDFGICDAPFDSRKIVVATCSGFRPLKRLPLLAKSLEQLSKHSEIPIQWFCIGNGDPDVITRDLEPDFAKTIVFTGRMKNEDLLRFYKNNFVSFFVNVSESEGVPVSIMEAQSFGIPVIATNVGGTSEIVNDSNGFLLPRELDTTSLCEMLGHAFELYGSKDYFVKRVLSRKQWEEMSNSEIIYKDWARFLQEF